MIARHETHLDKVDIWSALSAPLPPGVISWRQDGRPVTRDGRHIARFVAYIEANTVRERLDAVVPGEWDLTLELLPTITGLDEDANQGACSFKARLQILGVIREDMGTGKDYKQAATDAFKRAAVRFGIAHELYSYEQNWVQMDGDGKYAMPLEDPAAAYARRYGRPRAQTGAPRPVVDGQEGYGDVPAPARGETASGSDDIGSTARTTDEAQCPKCGGRCFDNRAENDARAARGEKLRPDWKCRDRNCDGVLWRAKKDEQKPAQRRDDESDEIPF